MTTDHTGTAREGEKKGYKPGKNLSNTGGCCPAPKNVKYSGYTEQQKGYTSFHKTSTKNDAKQKRGNKHCPSQNQKHFASTSKQSTLTTKRSDFPDHSTLVIQDER